MRTKTFCFTCLAAALLALAQPAASASLDDFRKAFAEAVYAGSPQLVHDRRPQPLLRAVVVLNIKLGEEGAWQTDVTRTNAQQPEMLRRAIDTVQRARVEAVPDELRDELKRNGIYETWLFERDGTFQVKTLAKAQRFGEN